MLFFFFNWRNSFLLAFLAEELSSCPTSSTHFLLSILHSSSYLFSCSWTPAPSPYHLQFLNRTGNQKDMQSQEAMVSCPFPHPTERQLCQELLYMAYFNISTVSPVVKITSAVPIETSLSVRHLSSCTLECPHSSTLFPVTNKVSLSSECILLGGETANVFYYCFSKDSFNSTETAVSNEEQIKQNRWVVLHCQVKGAAWASPSTKG